MKISENEDVKFYWSMVANNWVEEEANTLIAMMIDHWVTMRGFSYTSAFLESYKQENKKDCGKIQRSQKEVKCK